MISVNQFAYMRFPKTQNTRWSIPETMPAFDAGAAPPTLVADGTGAIHAFSSQWLTSKDGTSVKAVVYNHWSINHGWTEPIDILLSPIKEARVTDAHLDNTGNLHLVFWGGDGTEANIFYAQAPVESADNISSWSVPVLIGENAADPAGAVLLDDNAGNLHVVYSGSRDGNGLYVVDSNDHGQTWSEPEPIFLATSDAPAIFELHVIRGENGWFHAVWGVFSVGGQGRGIYYVNSEDGYYWNDPRLLQQSKSGLGSQTPNIIEYQQALYAVYNMPPKITMRRSLDNGKTWQDPMILFARHVGVNGSLGLVVDHNDNLHLFFGQRITASPDIHGMWHSVFRNNRWSEPEALIKGPQVNDPVGDRSFDPNMARAVVSQDNVLMVTWRTDPGFKANGVWYSYREMGNSISTAATHPAVSATVASDIVTPTALLMVTDQDSMQTTVPASTERPLDVNWKNRGMVLTTSNVLILNALASLVLVVLVVFLAIRKGQRKP
jgi:hypothetical protein